jgi:tannase/feruloyl esterase
MPASHWNAKFMGLGNGAMAGSISYGSMAAALFRGYAAASTDTGHEGSGQDGSFALGGSGKVIDFGDRAVHEMTVKAKLIVASANDHLVLEHIVHGRCRPFHSPMASGQRMASSRCGRQCGHSA